MSAAKYFRNWIIAVASVYVCVLVSLLVWGGSHSWELFAFTWYASSWVEKRTLKLRTRIEIEKVMSDNGELKEMISNLQDIANKAEEVKRGD
jgi:hypothetical protein